MKSLEIPYLWLNGAKMKTPKIEEATTSVDLNIKPGSGFGFGTDYLDREKDKLLQRRKKQLPKYVINQLIGEQSMIVVTYSSSSRDSIGLQFTLVNTLNETGFYRWKISPIQKGGSSYSFTVSSVGKDQYLSADHLDVNLVAGVTWGIHEVSKFSESELIAESMINAIVNGMDPKAITEAYLNKPFIEEEEPEAKDGESSAVDAIQKDILAMMRMTDNLKLSDSDAKEVQMHLDTALGLMKGKKESKKNQG